MIKRKNILKIAIDSPAAAGAGTVAKAISKNYNLFYLDTGKIYRFIAFLKLKFPKKFNKAFVKSKIKSLKIKQLSNKFLLSDKVGIEASIVSKSKNLRKIVHLFQTNQQYYDFYKKSLEQGRHVILDNSVFELEEAFDSDEFAKSIYASNSDEGFTETYNSNDLSEFNNRVEKIYLPKAEFLHESLIEDKVKPENMEILDYIVKFFELFKTRLPFSYSIF